MGSPSPYSVIAGQSQFEPTAQSQPGGQRYGGLLTALQFVQNGVRVRGEVVNVLDCIGSDFVDEELHVCTGNKGLTRSFECNRSDIVAGVQPVQRLT